MLRGFHVESPFKVPVGACYTCLSSLLMHVLSSSLQYFMCYIICTVHTIGTITIFVSGLETVNVV